MFFEVGIANVPLSDNTKLNIFLEYEEDLHTCSRKIALISDVSYSSII